MRRERERERGRARERERERERERQCEQERKRAREGAEMELQENSRKVSPGGAAGNRISNRDPRASLFTDFLSFVLLPHRAQRPRNKLASIELPSTTYLSLA